MRCLCIALLAACSADEPRREFVFEKRVIDPEFRSEGLAVLDVDNDGDLDLATEELWYAAPEFTPHELRPARAWDPLTEYASGFGVFPFDVDGDANRDLIVFHYPGTDVVWCRNPGRVEMWACHVIASGVYTESPIADDRVLLGTAPHTLGWMQPGMDPTQPWTSEPVITDPIAATFGHGLGIGDVDGDGVDDVVTGAGWRSGGSGAWHAHDLCPNRCAQMFVHDIDGDGRNDLLGTSPHDYGAWWWRQQADGTFMRSVIDDSISQLHAAAFVDLDGDGQPELVTGKRYWAHLDQDPGARDPVLLVAYRFHRDLGAVTWERIVIDDDSGVGSHGLVVEDVDGDSRPDIAVATKKGVLLFQQR